LRHSRRPAKTFVTVESSHCPELIGGVEQCDHCFDAFGRSGGERVVDFPEHDVLA
jgi:hypothetical protein